MINKLNDEQATKNAYYYDTSEAIGRLLFGYWQALSGFGRLLTPRLLADNIKIS